jgi:hypothetical protein
MLEPDHARVPRQFRYGQLPKVHARLERDLDNSHDNSLGRVGARPWPSDVLPSPAAQAEATEQNPASTRARRLGNCESCHPLPPSCSERLRRVEMMGPANASLLPTFTRAMSSRLNQYPLNHAYS